MELYSHNGRYPTELPARLRMPDGMTRRPPYSSQDLESAGWEGPFTPPAFNSTTQRLDWDGELKSFKVSDILPSTDGLTERLKRSFSTVEDLMLRSPVYAKVKAAAIASPAALVACIEFLNSFSAATQDPGKAQRVGAALDELVATCNLSVEDQQVINAMLAGTELENVIGLNVAPIAVPEGAEGAFAFNGSWITPEGIYTGPVPVSQEQ